MVCLVAQTRELQKKLELNKKLELSMRLELAEAEQAKAAIEAALQENHAKIAALKAIVKQQRWLLYLHHASKCQAAVGECPITPNCHAAKQLLEHALTCSRTSCNYPRCIATRELLEHHRSCKDAGCLVCGPVRNVMRKQRQRTLDGQKGIRHVKRRTRTGPFRHQRKNKFPKRAAVS